MKRGWPPHATRAPALPRRRAGRAPAALAAFRGAPTSGRYQGQTTQSVGTGKRGTISFRLTRTTLRGVRVLYELSCTSGHKLHGTAQLGSIDAGRHGRGVRGDTRAPFSLPDGSTGSQRFRYRLVVAYAGATRITGTYYAHVGIYDARGRAYDSCRMSTARFSATRRGR